MKHLDEYRDPDLARRLLEELNKFRRPIPPVIMEVCGGQTHSLLRHGLDEALEGIVELVHGPGCPVCVTPAEAIDCFQRTRMDALVLGPFVCRKRGNLS